MDKTTRNVIERATQQARKLLNDDFSDQLAGTFDVLRSGIVPGKGGAHLTQAQQTQREKIVAAIEHKRAAGMTEPDAITDYIRDSAFTTLNRFVALKMLETRGLVQECITKGESSAGYREFYGLAPGISLLPDSAGYRLYIECLFDEFSTEIKVLFDRRDASSVLWPGRKTFERLLAIVNAQELSGVWNDDETIGWVFQFFNSREERQAMRDPKQGGSQVPRNSREMAVRNQFFTPRYVVQFLVDNTLGRLWMEMLAEKSQLTSKCEYFVRCTDELVKPRPRKDPRDLRILDPACGSGHFLLYSFDLLLQIYEEGWVVEETAPLSECTGRTLRADYSTLADLRREAPRLIVEQNLYGVDIDPRCAQIAALVLWLRAQRAWKELGVSASERPSIERTHIVLSEPMPGDAALVEEFAAQLNPPFYRDLFKKMVHECRLAGELGALLRVEDGIAAELTLAREQFVKQRQMPGFLPGMEPSSRQGSFDLTGIDDAAFFHEAEGRLDQALRQFVEAASGKAAVRRRLFAGDAEQGIALIEILRTRFDVVLMNPPFGAASLGAKKEFEKSYPRTKNDVYAAFVERGIQLLHPNGLLGAITSRTGFFLSSFQKWREEILLKEAPPVVFADLGYGVLDSAMVEVAAYCLEKGRGASRMKTVFFRALQSDDKGTIIGTAIREPIAAGGRQRFEVEVSSFKNVPGNTFAYWAGPSVLICYKKNAPMRRTKFVALSTNQLSDDSRYARLWWEIRQNGIEQWVVWAKGRTFSPFYYDIQTLVRWNPKRETYTGFLGTEHRPLEKPASADWFFRPGLTWPRRSNRLSISVLPSGCVFGNKGPAIFVQDDDHTSLLALLGILNSRVFDFLLSLQVARVELAQSFEVGLVQESPIPLLTAVSNAIFSRLTLRAWSLKHSLDTSNETSHAFTLPRLLQVSGETLVVRAANWAEHVRKAEEELAAIQAQIDQRCFELYGIDAADRRSITDGFIGLNDSSELADTDADSDSESDEDGDTAPPVDAASLTGELVSWAVGIVLGRLDVRLATGVRHLPEKPDPFDPLPACSPGMLTVDNGLPLASPPSGYPIQFPENGILVDDPGHPRDLTAAVRMVFDLVFKKSADAWWSDVVTLLDPKDHDLRKWLSSSFFEYHLKRYSKSRRKAPIYWQLSVPSSRYSLWLYAHRFTRDTFFHLQSDVVNHKLEHEERQLADLIQKAGPNPSADQRKKIAAQEKFVEELRAILAEIKRVAPLWNPNLDDGIVLVMAPLWRLVPQHKAWQKELKSKWDELAAGKYNWANIAMHLWPERVVPKCTTDRSLAIAHGLEEVFWQKDQNDKWQPRPVPARPLEELVRERTSPAVKAALKSLLESADTAAPARRRSRTRNGAPA
jgi:hypothetical protein